ncbi:MAG: SDR family oxidoreductase [Ignavibacteriales bacterium]|nr:SDR family oxidoreductase [Ignavibacteriales bacterium]
MRNVLVTGGTGFIGSRLARELLRRGCSVRILRRRESNLRAIGDAKVEHVVGDVRDLTAVRGAVQGCDTVFHTTAVISHWRKERPLMYETNIIGTRNVVTATLEAGVQKFVYTSSVAAVGYEPDGAVADEDTAFNWQPYDIGYRNSKFEAEQEVLRAVRLGLPAVVVNPSTVIGPGDMRMHGGRILRDIYRKRIFYYAVGGMNVVYIDDVVRGHLSAAERGRIGERYILCGENMTYRELFTIVAGIVGGIKPLFKLPSVGVNVVAAIVEALANVAGRRPWVSRELVAGIGVGNKFSCGKAERELGYTVTPFKDAVEKTFSWCQQNQLL